MTHENPKAAHYLQELDQTRCDGNWEPVTELVRKVRKHAPDRKCIALAAESENATSSFPQGQPAASRPATAVANNKLTDLLPPLVSAIEVEQTHYEDRYQAQVCVGWIHWVLGEYGLAATRLPLSISQDHENIESVDKTSPWTQVCTVKSVYLRGDSLVRTGQAMKALELYESSLPSLFPVWAKRRPGRELKFWSELFLTRFCMLMDRALEDGSRALDDPNSLVCYRSWARFWDVWVDGTALPGGVGFRGGVPRRKIWQEYYEALSTILEDDLPFPTALVYPMGNETSARSQLRAELRKAEARYETLLLSETQFPRADEEREEMEEFVRLAMKNWTILTSRGWQEQDLGPGGRESLSRGVLDLLYRAATKTFHSTAILRHLFTVHLSVAEFDLAFKAFDTYLELIKKAKARVEKTGHQEQSLDDDDTILETICQCVKALCRYGNREWTEKALELGRELEAWFDKDRRTRNNPEPQENSNGNAHNPPPEVSPKVWAKVWQAVGLSQAQWARMTYDSSARTDIQAEAIQSLRRATSAEYESTTDVQSLFALGLLLAEQRDLDAAIDTVKLALAAPDSQEEDPNIVGEYSRERSLIPLWHLLALLLSARQDFLRAARSCEGAFEQFKDPSVLFGSQTLGGKYRSEHLNELDADDEKNTSNLRGLVDDMDDFEREAVLEIKMTQLALVELIEGPEVAVNATTELLSLYVRLFGTMEALQAPATARAATAIPKSSAGTIRSAKGSLFGSRNIHTARQVSEVTEKSAPLSSRPQTMQTGASIHTQAPTIQITHENGDSDESRRNRTSLIGKQRRSESQKLRNSLRKRDSSSGRRAVSSSRAHEATVIDGEDYFTPTSGKDREGWLGGEDSQITPRLPGQRSRTISQIDSSISGKSGSGQGSGADSQTLMITSNPLPVVQFTKAQEKRQRSAILVKVWLMIAGFYRRGGLHEDCRGAIDEAHKIVVGMEVDIANDNTGRVSLKNSGWGVKRSVEELWADVYTETANLSLVKNTPNKARGEFESALTHYANHPAAIVGLSDILLDIYNEALLPPPSMPPLGSNAGAPNLLPGESLASSASDVSSTTLFSPARHDPLGLGTVKPPSKKNDGSSGGALEESSDSLASHADPSLPPPYNATTLPLSDRLAARDRAYGLLSSLTKLGSGWNYSAAWFALARAYEANNQPDRAKEVLWWCVELEDGMGVREWTCVGSGGYVM